jgi:hypothetical protein
MRGGMSHTGSSNNSEGGDDAPVLFRLFGGQDGGAVVAPHFGVAHAPGPRPHVVGVGVELYGLEAVLEVRTDGREDGEQLDLPRPRNSG